MVASPSRNTLTVCVNVTIAPRKTACPMVPREPTRLRRHDGLAVSGRERVRGTQGKSHGDRRKRHPRSELLLMKEPRQGVCLQ